MIRVDTKEREKKRVREEKPFWTHRRPSMLATLIARIRNTDNEIIIGRNRLNDIKPDQVRR